MPTTVLSPEHVARIKERLWYGDTAESIAADYRIGSSLILGVRSGQRWATIQWPDGSVGKLPEKRAKQILKARREAQRRVPTEVAKILKRSETPRVARA